MDDTRTIRLSMEEWMRLLDRVSPAARQEPGVVRVGVLRFIARNPVEWHQHQARQTSGFLSRVLDPETMVKVDAALGLPVSDLAPEPSERP